VCFSAAIVLDGALATLELMGMVTGPTWQGDVYPGSVVALVLTVAVVLVAVAGFYCEWRQVVATRRLFNLAVACAILPALLVAGAVVAV
jgi:hypothetical protein